MKHTTLTKKLAFIILNSVFLILNLSSCYTWWEDKIPLDINSTPGNLSDLLYRKPPITSLEAPVQVIASEGIYNDSIKLRWTEVEHATSYRIERAVIIPDSNGNYAVPEEGDFALLEKYVYKTTYNDIILTNPGTDNSEYSNRYYYRICAENIRKGYESSDYTDISNPDTAASGWLLAPPKNIDAWKGKSESEIKITWNIIPQAKYYQVYRSEKERTGFELIDKIRGNQNYFLDEVTEQEQGQEFYYKVCAELSNGAVSSFSGTALGYSLKKGAPVAPANVKVENGLAQVTEGIKITWDNTSVPVSAGQTATFTVFRNSNVDSVYTMVNTNLPSTTSSIVDTKGLKPGIIYYYYVQTVIEDNGVKSKSPFSETGPKDKDPAVAFLLSAPSDIDIADTDNTGTVILKWTPAVGSANPYNIDYTYSIYFDYDQNGSYTEAVKTEVLPPINAEGLYEIEVSKYPFYKIVTVNGSAESLKSQPIAPYPEAPTKVTASKTSNLGGLDKWSYNTNEVYPVKITWEAPASGTPYGYYIYRSTNPSSSFRKLNEDPITDNSFVYYDENETARAGTIYYYKVISINTLGKGKNSNDPENDPGNNYWGYGAVTRDQWFREYNKSIMRSQSKLTLMHKANDMDKLGSETIKGDVSGSLSYKAAIAGLGAEITMHYQDYCDFYINGDAALGPYYVLTGNTDTTSNMSANGNMHEKVNCIGMYPGYAIYNNLQIKGGAAGGGYYLVETYDLENKVLMKEDKVDWKVGEQH